MPNDSWKKSIGKIRGNISNTKSVQEFPESLPAAVMPVAVPLSTDPKEVVYCMVKTYKQLSGGLYIKKLKSIYEGSQDTLTTTAKLVIQAHVSPEALVKFICKSHEKFHGGKFPFPWQVLGPKAIEGWLKSYAWYKGQVLKSKTYKSTEERKTAYTEWLNASSK